MPKSIMTPNTLIRPALLKDANELSLVCKQAFIETYKGRDNERPDNMLIDYAENTFDENSIKKAIAIANTWIWIALVDDNIVGYFKLGREKPPNFVEESTLLYLERIYLLQTHQNKGIGKLLLNKAESLTLEKKATGIWFSVWEKNREAIKFYLHMGYTVVGKHNWEFEYQSKTFIDIDNVMIKILKPQL